MPPPKELAHRRMLFDREVSKTFVKASAALISGGRGQKMSILA
jgi:hypothetical protein